MRPARLAAVTVALGAVLAVAGCTSSDPTLLDRADFDGVQDAVHDEDGAYAPGWTWCTGLSPSGYFRPAPTSQIAFPDRTLVGATIIDRSDDGLTADGVLSLIQGSADVCAADEAAAESGYSIEPIGGLDADTVGWRTASTDGEHGEFAVITLNHSQLLAVGWSTTAAEPPVTLDELIGLAREGAERVGIDD